MDLASAMQLSSAALGILAAIAWGLSAIGKVPSPSSGWGGPVSNDDPFIKALNRAACYNRYGAGFAAAAAMLSALSIVV